MPLPIPQLKPGSSSVGKPRYKIFVSYSHKNSYEAKQFIDVFKAAISVSPDLEIAPEQVFFDRETLLAGDQWGESIQQAMDEAKYFVILLSKESISSEYCLHRELATAAIKGLPIIQVLLNKDERWEDRIIPGDLRMRKLSSFGALPKDSNSNYLPVAEWPEASQAEVWKGVAHGILERVRRDRMESQYKLLDIQEISQTAQQRRVPPIPYFCNQKGPVNQFNGGVQRWKDKAFLVLTRGLYEDDLPRFWDRLQHKNLKDYVKTRQEELLPARPFVWPDVTDDQPDRGTLCSQMLRAMSEALTGNMFEVGDLSSFSAHVSALSGIQPFVTTLPDISIKAIRSGLRTFLDLLDQCPAEVPVQRLVIAVILEDSVFGHEAALEARFGLNAYQRTHVVVLDPLQVIEHRDVRIWHRDYEVERLYQIDEDTILHSVFSEKHTKSLRMREFAKKVAPFIREMEKIL